MKGGIAIPHGAENLVTKPVICITKLDKPIVWDGFNTVDLVCVLALNEKSTKYFEQFYQVISDEIMVSRIRSCHTQMRYMEFCVIIQKQSNKLASFLLIYKV